MVGELWYSDNFGVLLLWSAFLFTQIYFIFYPLVISLGIWHTTTTEK